MLCGTPKSDIASWCDKRIFVLGDVLFDRFVSGRVERLSPEKPRSRSCIFSPKNSWSAERRMLRAT